MPVSITSASRTLVTSLSLVGSGRKGLDRGSIGLAAINSLLMDARSGVAAGLVALASLTLLASIENCAHMKELASKVLVVSRLRGPWLFIALLTASTSVTIFVTISVTMTGPRVGTLVF